MTPDFPLPGGVSPDEMIARAMQTVRMTNSAGAHGWEPQEIEEVGRLFPTYEVLALLGRGGMGAVYQARQTALDRLVAIKLLPLEISIDQAFADRFRREARTMAKLNHPHIISVFDFGTTSEGHLFIVMEYVEGANLHDIIHQVGLEPAQALLIVEQICAALGYAHGKGVVHRDIKPANVMIDTESQVKVADFGLARLLDSGTADLGHTVTGTVMGTPDYMAPEQMQGMNVDHRADIYSLGVMIYEMLCRQVPRGIFQPPSQRTGCDARIDAIVIKAMQQAPDHRYQSTQEMKADVTAARSGPVAAQATSVPADPLTPVVHPRPVGTPAAPRQSTVLNAAALPTPAKKSRVVLFASVAAVALAVVLGLVFGKRAPRDNREKSSPPASISSPATATKDASRMLFDGKTLAGWHGFGGSATNAGWRVVDGAIVAPSARTFLVTDETFAEFDLQLEWKVGPSGNGGIFFRFPTSGDPLQSAMEFQLCATDVKDGFPAGSLHGVKKPDKEAQRPTGEWNTARLLVKGGHCEHWINGQMVCAYDIGSDEWKQLVQAGRYANKSDYAQTVKGGIALQSWTGEVSYRNIRILPPDGGTGAASASAATPAAATKEAPFENSLGMKFVPVPGTKVLFSIWDTRVMDYEKYAAAKPNVDGSWKTQEKDGVPVGREPDHPVVGVSWDDAHAFCAWLTEKETTAGTLPKGAKCRLPTDAEWSTAVGLPPEQGATPEEKSGKNDADFPWGKEWPPKGKVGNYADETYHTKFPPKKNETEGKMENANWIKGYNDGYATTSPVGIFPANAHGLHDMGGNVWEWCEDWHDANHTQRVLRGASWAHLDRAILLSSNRLHSPPALRSNGSGFRCVLEPAPSPAALGTK